MPPDRRRTRGTASLALAASCLAAAATRSRPTTEAWTPTTTTAAAPSRTRSAAVERRSSRQSSSGREHRLSRSTLSFDPTAIGAGRRGAAAAAVHGNGHFSANREPLMVAARCRNHCEPSGKEDTGLMAKIRAAFFPAKGRARGKKRALVVASAAMAMISAFLLLNPRAAAAMAAKGAETMAAEGAAASLGAASSAAAAAAPITAPSTAAAAHLARPLGSSPLRVLPTSAELDLCCRLLAASLGGAAVGLERSSSDRPAGVRTMALVSLGAAAFSVCSMYGFLSVAAHSTQCAKFDPSRMASNVASGVGFIGAGVITNNRKAAGVYDRQSSVNGLTTAAAIWVSAAIGVACGVGLYFVGAASALSTIAILRFGRVKHTEWGQRMANVSVGKKRRKKKLQQQQQQAMQAGTAATAGGAASASKAETAETPPTLPSLSNETNAQQPAVSPSPSEPVVAGDGLASYVRGRNGGAAAAAARINHKDLLDEVREHEEMPSLVSEMSMLGTVTSTTASSSKEEKVGESKTKKKTKKKAAAPTSDGEVTPVTNSGKGGGDSGEKMMKKKKKKTVQKGKSALTSDPLMEKYIWGTTTSSSSSSSSSSSGDVLKMPPSTSPPMRVSVEEEQEVVLRKDDGGGGGGGGASGQAP